MSRDSEFNASDAIELLDWKHSIFDLYAEIRRSEDSYSAWQRWLVERDRLYRDHPQSPLTALARKDFSGCSFFDYDASWRMLARIEDVEPAPLEIAVSTGARFQFTRIGVAHFDLHGVEHELELTWNEGYGGGLFLAFTDETSGSTTYGGGRYLIATVKGADLGFDHDKGTALLDFNFAYNPSCSYDPRWACPLAPSANRLGLAVTVGEQLPRGSD